MCCEFPINSGAVDFDKQSAGLSLRENYFSHHLCTLASPTAAGITPTDHARANAAKVKEQSRINALRKVQESQAQRDAAMRRPPRTAPPSNRSKQILRQGGDYDYEDEVSAVSILLSN